MCFLGGLRVITCQLTIAHLAPCSSLSLPRALSLTTPAHFRIALTATNLKVGTRSFPKLWYFRIDERGIVSGSLPRCLRGAALTNVRM
jgi:hypothetical protein